MTPLLTFGVLAVVLPLLYMYTASVAQTRLPTLRNKRICLLIAHPDDEAMFFAPSVLALTRPESHNHVKIVCLSSGNADGLGETRRKELVKSGLLLGLKHDSDVVVLDDPDFEDSMTITWETAKISSFLTDAFALNSTASKPSSNQDHTVFIDTLITFDAGGVSGHPNHISLYHGARAFVSSLTQGKRGSVSPVDLYTLTTVALPRKYLGFLDVFATMVSLAVSGGGGRKSDAGSPGALVSMNALAGGGRESYGAARQAMTEAHKSQMVWFRWGWIALSRYMYINDLRLERVKS
ncbi:LmbE-like protein [Annulohypoxylon bovei var. microspora]|nr:LmbE-like protein [Annulohypoxylon bovei var. microspora]